MRLIDADALLKQILETTNTEENAWMLTLLTGLVHDAPTAEDTNVPSKWISVKKKLPEEHESMFYKLLGTPKLSNSMWKQESEKVLVYVSFPDGTGVVTTGCLHNSDWVTTVSKTLPQTVTHWMPLPEPPEVRKDD